MKEDYLANRWKRMSRSEAQCNVIMAHASSRPFIKHYQL